MTTVTRDAPTADPMFASYLQLSTSLLKDFSGLCLMGADLKSRGHSRGMDPPAIARWLNSQGWDSGRERAPASLPRGPGEWLTALPLQQSDGQLLGVFCVSQTLATAPAQPSRHALAVAQQLKPVLECVHREFAAAVPVAQRVQDLSERTAELEWLFQVTGKLKGACDDRRVAEDLLIASRQRLGSTLGVLAIPEKRLLIMGDNDTVEAATLRDVWKLVHPQLLSWAQREKSPFIMNKAGQGTKKIPPCKILSVPVVRDSGRVLGVLAFFNTPEYPDFAARHVFLARHLGRETAGIVDAQFDLMTGLYTRGGLEQMYASLDDEDGTANRTVLYIDVDHMNVINELHGFELGNELIVRSSDLLAPPMLPADAIAARIAGDRFAVILPNGDPAEAARVADQLQGAAHGLLIGPTEDAIDVSISCGVASLVAMPQGLGRAMAAAEIACKTAKSRGRNRVELYAMGDGSMMRHHEDAMAVGQLRAALRNNQMILYAQRITPLQNPALPGGYELLLRVRGADGEMIAPGPMLQAALRYQLLPSVDRWVIKNALQMLTPYRSMLRSRGISISINMTGQTIDDETCIQSFMEQLKEANLPAECIMIEITEQAAVKNLARANEMMQRLRTQGCRFALDDFGTGANSLTYVKTLQIARVKIDGSFVRDVLTNKNSAATVRAVVELAKSLSLDTVAEYVESDAIAAEVRRLGVDYAQGYAFGRPQPLDRLLEELGRDESARLHRLFLEM